LKMFIHAPPFARFWEIVTPPVGSRPEGFARGDSFDRGGSHSLG
jgi:hypothetical protein